MPEESMP